MKTLTLCLLSMLGLSGFAQTSSYTFTREGGQISYLNPNDDAVKEHQVQDGSVLPAKVAIGFPFRFNGATYDSVGISENGYIWFGPAQASDLVGIINPMTANLPAGVKGVVCAFGIDLHPHENTNLTTTIRSCCVAFAGQADDFIVEWRNTSRLASLNDPAGEDTLGFQIQLFRFEADRVQITYGYDIGLNPNVTSQLSVGMRGESQNDFANRMTDTTHTWDNTLAGTASNSTCELSTMSNPGLVLHNYMSWLNNNPNTGIDEHQVVSEFMVYPVPANDVVYLRSLDGNKNAGKYTIYNIEGKQVMDGTYTTKGIQTEGLSKGVYILAIQSENGVTRQKFIKN